MSVISSIINTAGSIANARNSQSTNVSDSYGSSWGSSASSSWSKSQGDAWGDSYANSHSESIGESNANEWGWGAGGSDAYSSSVNRTFGREASAQDILNAAEANQVQRDLWSMQADYNAKQAQIDRDWQEYMSNTAYQRAVIDLLKAGLNPILAAGNMGASTPVGAMASASLATSHKANAYAESRGSSNSASTSWNRSENGGSSYSYNKSTSDYDSKSHNESHDRSSGGSKSSSSEGSSNRSHSEGQSTAKTQLDQMAGIINDLTNAGSAKARTGQPYNPKTANPNKNGSDAHSTKNNGHTKRPAGLS